MTRADDRLTAGAGESSPRRRLSRADREQQVLRVAHEQFARRGFAAVTMEDIALEVGVKKPLLYAYFGNKERLYEACMAPAGEALIAAVAAAVERASTPAEAVRLGVIAFFDFVDRDRDAWRVLFDETVPQSGEIAAAVAAYRERLLEMVALATVAVMPPHRRTGSRAVIEGTSVMVMAAAEALARWWLRTDAMPARDAANLLIATVEPGLLAGAVEKDGVPSMTVADRSMGLGLRALTRIAGSDVVDRLGVRKPAERALYRATRDGFKVAGRAGRTFAAGTRLGRPARPRPSSAGGTGLFDLTLDDEQQMLVEAWRDFASARLRPAAAAAERGEGAKRGLRRGQRARPHDARRPRGARRGDQRALRGDRGAGRRDAGPR